MKYFVSFLLVFFIGIHVGFGEDGYELWLRYKKIENVTLLKQYQKSIRQIVVDDNTETGLAIRNEINTALKGLLTKDIPFGNNITSGSVVIATTSSPLLSSFPHDVSEIQEEGYKILSTKLQGKSVTLITAKNSVGLLYGTFHWIRLLQSHQSLNAINITSNPKINLRLLNHWDNLDGTVERGYAGFSLWDWHKLPDYIDPRYTDYARANASIGINGTVLTNVNSNALILRPDYLEKVKSLADVFRPYGIKVYLTARFSAPIELGKLPTADPLDPSVQQWWNTKIEEIYKLIPDFGGFLVKANSEGQPGPHNYHRTHADGANMLAKAVKPHGGIVMWRAFVYENEVPEDRARQAYSEFQPLDGKFDDNVMIQVKNGAIDFQPREPFHPLFGAMPKTPLMMEFQITQEYLGFATHLVFLPSLFKEVLSTETHTASPSSTVGEIIDGSVSKSKLTGIAGVANIGNDRNWCGHPLGNVNWYGYGRLAWDHTISEDALAEEWIRLALSSDNAVIQHVKDMLLNSHEAVVNYMTPLGLHHIMGYSHHYGPAPWINFGRSDWTSVYYHRADSLAIGFDRTTHGSNAIGQYAEAIRNLYGNLENCPEKYLLWFHRLPWTYKLKSGKTLWDELCYKYQEGVDQVAAMQTSWNKLEGKVDDRRFNMVKDFLVIQHKEACWWRDACLSYFQSFSKLPIPAGVPNPPHSLEYYKELRYPYAPGIKPNW
jgi:alpha-glucuronidase